MLMFRQAQIWNWIVGFLWPFARIAGCLMVAPGFGAGFVPRRTRLLLSFALAVMVAPLVSVQPNLDPIAPSSLVSLGLQVLVGIAIGFLLQIVFDAVGLAGQLVANAMGLSFAFNIDPMRGTSTPAVGQLYLVFVTLTFLSLDGHIAVIRALVDSFNQLPLDASLHGDNLARHVVESGGTMIYGALRIALPGVAALLIANLAFGFVSRAAPSLNVTSVGLPAALMFGMVVLQFSMAGVQDGFIDLFERALRSVAELQ